MMATLCLADTKGTPEDEKAIRKVIADSSAAWNRHDLRSETTATDEFDINIPPGNYMKAGPEMESQVKRDFEGGFKNARETRSTWESQAAVSDMADVP